MRKFEFRPWGWYITLDEGINYKVKKIHLNPNTKLSLQYHHHRDEHWTVVEGSGKAIVNKNVFIMNDGDDMFIAKKAVHRMEASPDGVTFVEVQRGKCDEEDIVRLQDDYLMEYPEHRLAAKRVLASKSMPYGEIRDNLISKNMKPLDMLRCKLSFFGATKFDPRSDRWVRICMYQNAPLAGSDYSLYDDFWPYPDKA